MKKYIKKEGKLATSTTGALSELVVSSDLLSKGYDVFKSVSPSCFCDLLIHKKNIILKIEVRTGYKNQRGDIGYSKNTHGNIDIFAVYIREEKEIYYFTKQFKTIKL